MTNSALKALDLTLAREFTKLGLCEEAIYSDACVTSASVLVYFDRERVRLEGTNRVVRRQNVTATIVLNESLTKLPTKGGIIELLDGSKWVLEQMIPPSDESQQTWGVNRDCSC
jgi:hypothetical protein